MLRGWRRFVPNPQLRASFRNLDHSHAEEAEYTSAVLCFPCVRTTSFSAPRQMAQRQQPGFMDSQVPTPLAQYCPHCVFDGQ